MDNNFSASSLGKQPLISYAPPSGFLAALDGIYTETVNKDGEVDKEWLCAPLTISHSTIVQCSYWISKAGQAFGFERR